MFEPSYFNSYIKKRKKRERLEISKYLKKVFLKITFGNSNSVVNESVLKISLKLHKVFDLLLELKRI